MNYESPERDARRPTRPTLLPSLETGTPTRQNETTWIGTLWGKASVAAALAIVVALVTIPVSLTVDAVGTLEPDSVRTIHAATSGIVRHVLVRPGAHVVEGEPIVVLDSLSLATSAAIVRSQLRDAIVQRVDLERQFELTRTQRSASARAAEARLLQARAALRDKLFNYGFRGVDPDSLLRHYLAGSNIAIDVAVGEVRAAQAALEAAHGDTALAAVAPTLLRSTAERENELALTLRQAEEGLDRLVIRSPATGVVLSDSLDYLEGAFVREGDAICDVGDNSRWAVKFLLADRDIHRIHLGDSVRVKVMAFAVDTAPSVISARVVGIATTDLANGRVGAPGVGLYPVKASIDSTTITPALRRQLRRGFTAEAHVIRAHGSLLSIAWAYVRGLTE